MVARVLSICAVVLLFVGLPAGAWVSAWGVWREAAGWITVLLFIGTVLSMWVGCWWLDGRRAGAAAGALFVLNAAWLVLVIVRSDMREAQTMHDRGVTESAVVTERIHTSDLMSGVDDKVTAVRLALPSVGAVHLELKGASAPAVGESVQVTRDPQGRVPIRLGPRPRAPGGTLATIALVVVIGSALVCAAAASRAVAKAVDP